MKRIGIIFAAAALLSSFAAAQGIKEAQYAKKVFSSDYYARQPKAAQGVDRFFAPPIRSLRPDYGEAVAKSLAISGLRDRD
jgi:hypothetical protein